MSIVNGTPIDWHGKPNKLDSRQFIVTKTGKMPVTDKRLTDLGIISKQGYKTVKVTVRRLHEEETDQQLAERFHSTFEQIDLSDDTKFPWGTEIDLGTIEL